VAHAGARDEHDMRACAAVELSQALRCRRGHGRKLG
jgi:hypothetical protein